MAAGAALSGVSLCPFAALTGIPCPGCGLLRATVALMRGHFAESVHIHPLALVAVPVTAFAVLCVRSGKSMTRRAETLLTASMTALVVAMMAVWISRLGGAFGGPVSVHSIWSPGSLGREALAIDKPALTR